MLKDAIRRLAKGEPLASIPQDRNEGGYYGFPEAGEFAALAEKVFPLYDPTAYVELLRCWVPEFGERSSLDRQRGRVKQVDRPRP